MGITSALVLFAVLWFLTLFVVLPFRLETQGDRGEVTQGTPQSAPAEINMRRKMKITTIIAFCLWVPLCAIIVTGAITIDDVDLYKRFGGGLDKLE